MHCVVTLGTRKYCNIGDRLGNKNAIVSLQKCEKKIVNTNLAMLHTDG